MPQTPLHTPIVLVVPSKNLSPKVSGTVDLGLADTMYLIGCARARVRIHDTCLLSLEPLLLRILSKIFKLG